METMANPPIGRYNARKLLSIGIVIVVVMVLSIPLAIVTGNREETYRSAARSVSKPWGDEQSVAGLYLLLPYGDEDGHIRRVAVLPESLTVTGEVETTVRKRGIYSVPLYKLRATIDCRLPRLDSLVFPSGSVERIQWKSLELMASFVDQTGVREVSLERVLPGGGTDRMVMESSKSHFIGYPFQSTLSSKIGLKDATGGHFRLRLTIQGSTSLYVIPFGGQTQVDLTMNTTRPSFKGNFLPDSYSIKEGKTKAHWSVATYSRTFAPGSSLLSEDESIDPEVHGLGVEFLQGPNHYDKTMRTLSYGIVFILVSFLIIFFSEVLTRRNVPIFAYLLTGCALMLFFLILLAVGEHIPFAWAYLVATVVIIGMILTYMHSYLRRWGASLTLACSLAFLYAYFYALLQLTDYALLFGTVLMTVVLGLAMYFSRRIEW